MEIDDFGDDFQQKKSDNNYIISNRGCFHEEVNPKAIRAVQFIQLKTEEVQKQSKNTKQKIKAELENAHERLLNLIMMVNSVSMANSQIKLKSMIDGEQSTVKNESSSLRKLQRVNFLKKSDHFAQCIKSFRSDLIKKRENCSKSQDILAELLELKSKGFFVENNFQLNNRSELNNNIVLQNQYIVNFSQFFNISKYNFILNVKNPSSNNDDKKFELKNDFYTYFNRKFKIVFEFELQIDNTMMLSANQYQMEEIINCLLSERLLQTLNQRSKYFKEIATYLKFYFKYLLYKFLKIEVSTLLKNSSNVIKEKGFTLILSKKSNGIAITSNFYNQLQFSFKVSKINLADYNNTPNMDINALRIVTSSHVGKIIKIFFNNLFYDIRIFSLIKDFYNLSINNPSVTELINSGILIKNIVKTSRFLLRKVVLDKINEKLQEKDNLLYIMTNSMNLINTTNEVFITKIMIFKSNLYSMNMIIPSELTIEFNMKGNIVIDLKQAYPDQIYVIDKLHYSLDEFNRLDFNYLAAMIDNIQI